MKNIILPPTIDNYRSINKLQLIVLMSTAIGFVALNCSS